MAANLDALASGLAVAQAPKDPSWGEVASVNSENLVELISQKNISYILYMQNFKTKDVLVNFT